MVTSSTPNGSVPDIRNRLVNFKIRDVYIPDPREILVELYANDILQGRVLDLTDTGSAKQAFVVVEVEGVSRTSSFRSNGFSASCKWSNYAHASSRLA